MPHHLIFIPGAGDHTFWLTKILPLYKGVTTEIHVFGWQTDTPSLIEKQQALLDKIDARFAEGKQISLVGTSAGARAAINALAVRRDKIHKVVSVCGRIRTGPYLNRLTPFEQKHISVRALKECEQNLSTLTDQDRVKILTIRPLYDDVVPVDTVPIPGATNIVIPSILHSLSIAVALAWYRRRIGEFCGE